MMEKKERIKLVKIFIGIMLLALLSGSALATQSVAKDCNYDPILGFEIGQIYPPWQFWIWQRVYVDLMPQILHDAELFVFGSMLIGVLLIVLIVKSGQHLTTHGSADWANLQDLIRAKITDKEGVVLGINPFTKKLLMHDGPEHILLMAPTRSGKGICVIITTLLKWLHSVFVTDVKGENYEKTAGFRKRVLKQKIIKFEPMNDDGSSARWNPLAEIHFRSNEEFSDIQNIVTMIVDPEGKGQLDYWANTGSALLIGTILHLMYTHYVEEKPLPTLTNVARFLSSPENDIDEQLEHMKVYPHITPEDFLSGNNIFQEIYGEYVTNFEPYNTALNCDVHTIDALKKVIQDQDNIDFCSAPFNALLTHPRVAEAAAEMLNKAPNEKSGVLSTAKTFLNLYQNPVVAKNISVSDFCINDLLDPREQVSFYLVIPPRDLATLKPLCRLLINSVLRTLIKKMEFGEETKHPKKQRLLLMLDEFPQFGRLDTMETALAVCAGYGIKVCVVAQDINQLNKAYTKDNSISANCHVQVYFTPNLDTGGATAQQISKMLGKKTILTQSKSEQGGLFKNSTNTSSMGRELMTPDEVAKMDSEKEIIFVAGHKPVLGKKLRYYMQPFFMKRLFPPPLVSDKCTYIYDFASLMKVHEVELAALRKNKEKIRQFKKQAEQEGTQHAANK